MWDTFYIHFVQLHFVYKMYSYKSLSNYEIHFVNTHFVGSQLAVHFVAILDNINSDLQKAQLHYVAIQFVCKIQIIVCRIMGPFIVTYFDPIVKRWLANHEM